MSAYSYCPKRECGMGPARLSEAARGEQRCPRCGDEVPANRSLADALEDLEEEKHSFQFQGVFYRTGEPLPGSSAREVIYLDRFFCSHCLEIRDQNHRVVGNSFNPPVPGTFPA